MKFFIARWDDALITLDLDPQYTTIATVKTIIIDEYKASLIAEGHRVLRDHCLPSAVTLYYNEHELTAEETLAEYGITENALMETAHNVYKATRKRYGQGFDDTWTQEFLLSQDKQRRREERKRAKGERAHKAKEDLAESLEWGTETAERESAMEAESTEACEQSAELEEEANHVEDTQAQGEGEELWEGSSQEGSVQIRPDDDESDIVRYQMLDPYQTEDEDKENWDPQIIRVPVGNALPRRRRS